MILGMGVGVLLLLMLAGMVVTFWLAGERARLLDENERLRRLLADESGRQ